MRYRAVTVKELITELKRFPEDLEVEIYDDNKDDYLPVAEIILEKDSGYSDEDFIGLRRGLYRAEI